MKKSLKKIVATLLLFCIFSANLSTIGKYGISYALEATKLSSQDATTQDKNVEFNSYFEGGEHTKTESIENTTKLFVNVKVKKSGYLRDGVISFKNANFIMGQVENENIQKIDKENNKIFLNQLNNGSDVTLEIPISVLSAEKISIDNFSKETLTDFNGTYINGDGETKAISKQIVNELSWKGEAEGVVETKLTKYIPYVKNENYGVMLQTKVSSKIKDSKLPIKETQIEVQVPEINNVKPTSANVIAVKTLATNGENNGTNFTKENYSYNNENGLVEIKVSNTSNEIIWVKDVQDEYLVTFIFAGKEIYDYAIENGVNTTSEVNSKITVYNNKNTTVTAMSSVEIKLNEELGKLTDFEIYATNTINKGQIYANYEAINKKEVGYNLQYVSIISSAELTDKVEFNQEIDQFIDLDDDKNATTVENDNYTYNKSIKVSQKVFNKILGEEGIIEIYNSNNEKIAEITKDTELKEENYVLNISSSNSNKLTIATSKPITEGQLIINIEKAIKTNIDYSKEQFKTFTKICTEMSANNEKISKEILLKEPTSVASMEINKKDLTTVVKNENVEIKVTLDTSKESRALYKNPTIEVELPSYISNVKLNSCNILMGNGLKIKGEPTITTKNGAPVIKVTLEGNQTEYTIDAQYKGTIIILDTDLTVKTLTPTNKNKIVMKFTNENEESTNNKGTVESEIKFVAPENVVAANGISNYADGKNDILSISNEGATGIIETYDEARVATINGKIVNNYENPIKDVVILGRIPAEDNTNTNTNNELGSTFDTTLKSKVALSGIDSSKYEIYYSTNPNATEDLKNENNDWTKTATTDSQSYMIVTDDYEMKSGEVLETAYNVEIPANLSANNSAYEMYQVSYTNLSSIGEIQETKTSPIVGVTTGAGPELSVELTSKTQTAREGQIVTFIATVKNIGTIEAKNVKLNITAPDGTIHTEILKGDKKYTDSSEKNKIISLGDLAVGKVVTKEYELKIQKGKTVTTQTVETESGNEEITIEESTYPGDKEIENIVSVTVDNLSNEIKSNIYKLNVLEGDLQIVNIPNIFNNETIKKGKVFEFKFKLANISNDKDLDNVTLNMNIPNGIKIHEVYYGDDILLEEKNTENVIINENNISVNVGKLESLTAFIKENEEEESSGPKDINLRTQAFVCIKLELEDFTGEFVPQATATADGIQEHYSNVKKYSVESVNLTLTQKELDNKYIKEGKEYTYNFVIENTGEIDAISNVFEIQLPEELSFVKAEYKYNGTNHTVKSESNGTIKIYDINKIQPGEKINIQVTVKANLLSDKNDKEVTTFATLEANGFDKIESNKVKAIIEYNESAHKTDGNGENTNADTYKITGTAWVDSNKNGMRDEDEELLPNVKVMLIYKSNNKIVKDLITNDEKITTTDNEGKYQFENLSKGEYLVVFVYDSSRYSITEYQKEGVAKTLNSDFIDINIVLEGEKRVAGISDVIKITDENVRDIDIGVYTSEKFDLRLDKYITKITLTTPTIGTKTYTYDNTQLEKIEVLSRNLGKSSIVIEYKIVVTNEGAIPGYAKKIADYLPKGVTFNTELNKNWYLSNNGNVYNTSLENTIINPGESKEVTLVLVKQITEDSIGILNNNAEIYESYNEQGLKDIDSMAANKATDEDDMSKADIVLGVVTGGEIFIYVVLTLAILSILTFGIFEIKKRVLDKRNV